LNTTGKDIIDLQYYLVKISKNSSLIPSGNIFKSFSLTGANAKNLLEYTQQKGQRQL
jgi:hypothetical protein